MSVRGGIKPIHSITDLKLEERQVKLAEEIANYYRTSMTRSLRLMIPTAIWRKGKVDEPKEVFYRLLNSEVLVRGGKTENGC